MHKEAYLYMEEITKDSFKGHIFMDLPDIHDAIQKTECKCCFVRSFINFSPVYIYYPVCAQSLSCV